MATRDGLRGEARQSTRNRGHHLGDWIVAGHLAVANCRDCGMEVRVNAKPLPNEIDIGGEAVALDCTRDVGSFFDARHEAKIERAKDFYRG